MSHAILSLIDHAVLKPTHTIDDICDAAILCRECQVASMCVKPGYVEETAEMLAGSGVSVSTVIGFPHGGTSTAAKVEEAGLACDHGAVELDMVVNLGRVIEAQWDLVAADIRQVVQEAQKQDALVKVILETGLLLRDELKVRVCQISEEAGAAFVKTSTGFAYVSDNQGQLVASGATDHDVKLLRESCGPAVGVKASGGIRNFTDAQRFVDLGATRLGTSSTQIIAEEATS